MGINYIFSGENLKSIEIELTANVKNERQMNNLVNNLTQFMDEEFEGSRISDNSDEEAVDICWCGEATDISLYYEKNSGNRNVIATVDFYDYIH